MNAKLVYEIIKSLPKEEYDKLLDMLEPEMKKFDLETFIQEEVEKIPSFEEVTFYLIDTVFRKIKDK